MESKELVDKIGELILSKKGYDVKALDLRSLTSFTDYFVIASADSDTQVKAIADCIEDNLTLEGVKCLHKEGFTGLNWVLLDYVDVVVHIFLKESRNFYNLEKLWGDAPVTIIEDK